MSTISCIMPTYNRREFIPRAIEYFLRQDYEPKELIIVDDGTDPIGDLVPQDDRIRHIRLNERISVGAKRNRACEAARGDIIAHWDDDDWHAPQRLRYQIEALQREHAEVCGINRLLFYDAINDRAWRYVYPAQRRFWLSGSSLCYTRSFWAAHRFANLNVGEDARFVWSGMRARMIALPDYTFHVGVIHAHNVSPKRTNSAYWQAINLAEIQRVVGDDLSQLRITSASPTTSVPLISCIMPTFNRRAFIPLAVQHFLAQDYPNKELVIVDDGDDAIGDLVNTVPGVRYIRLSQRISIGAKRNLACREARGELIAQWDDDDWYAPDRLSYQARPILDHQADLTGLENTYLLELPVGRFWTTHHQLHQRMFVGDVHGGTLVFRKNLLNNGLRYPEVNLAEDAGLLKQALRRGKRLARLPNPGVFVYVRHGKNAWQFAPGKFLDPKGWRSIDPPRLFTAEMMLAYQAALTGVTPASDPPPDHTHLDALPRLTAEAGYGTLGLRGQLGYENKLVRVQGQADPHAISLHPPGRAVFNLNQTFARFTCEVALNDDVPAGRSWADFSVRGDGRLMTVAAHVVAGDAPRSLEVDVRGVDQLELNVETDHWDFCHAVWLHPRLDRLHHIGATPRSAPNEASEFVVAQSRPDNTIEDCLGRVSIALPEQLPVARRCIATIASQGFADLLDDALGSLVANGQCPDAQLLVFVIDADPDCVRVAQKYGAAIVHCTPKVVVNLTVKAVLYSVARVMEAEQYLCLDADMLVLGDLHPIFAALEACPPGSILATNEGNDHRLENLAHALLEIYGGTEADEQRLFRRASEVTYPLVVNDGLFAGTHAALLALDAEIRDMTDAQRWMSERPDVWWRNQFIFNLALARLQCGIELDSIYNLQLHVHDAELRDVNGHLEATWLGRRVQVLHFSGNGRRKYPEFRGRFARVADPLAVTDGSDDYAVFVAALRVWIGRHGLSAMAWSFYGTTDGKQARITDAQVFPLLAALHYLIRSNGVIRVIEAGTARGVSAACLASAVAHRSGGRVVTLDPYPNADRLDLWAGLPDRLRNCIEPRTTGSIEGLRAAIDASECYEAALLDSVHTEEHVWAEFELAVQVVCPGGLILIHDARYQHGTVDRALQRIEAAGYNVVRLWCAEGGVAEDDHLGLAVIENRRR
jgi:glycosyltransferase involved in cell wall biosynthesis/predicted O-methyltransferase YrrM